MKIILPFFALLFSHALFAQSKDCWPAFRGGQQMQGVSSAGLPASPQLLWTFTTEDDIIASPVACNGILVVGSVDGCLYALNQEGEELWNIQTENAIEAPALIFEETVFVGNMDGTLLAFGLYNGEQRWRYQAGNQIMGSPNWWKQGNEARIIVGSYDYALHCVDARTGTLQWKYESDNYVNGAAAITGRLAVFGGCDGFLHIVDIISGKLNKKVDVATYIAGTAALDGNKAYLGDYDGRLSCIDMEKGKVDWAFEDPEYQLPFIASPALSGNRIVIGGRDKNIYCIDKRTGKLLWRHRSGSRVDASTIIISEKVLTANMRGDVQLLSLKDGAPLWSYEIGSPIEATPACTGGRFFIGAKDGKVYCFGNQPQD